MIKFIYTEFKNIKRLLKINKIEKFMIKNMNNVKILLLVNIFNGVVTHRLFHI